MRFRYLSSFGAESFEITDVDAIVAAQSLARFMLNFELGTQQSIGSWSEKATKCAGWKDRS